MSIMFSLAKLKGEERRAILQAIESQMQQVIIDGVTQVLQEFLEQEVTTKLGRAKRSPRRISSQARPVDWQCAPCGCSDANQFTKLRPLPPQPGDRMGAPGRVAGADAGMPVLPARRGSAVCHLGEVSALLAGCTTSSYLRQWSVPELTPLEPAMGSHARFHRGPANHQ